MSKEIDNINQLLIHAAQPILDENGNITYVKTVNGRQVICNEGDEGARALKENPTHTILVERSGDELLLAWAACHSEVDPIFVVRYQYKNDVLIPLGNSTMEKDDVYSKAYGRNAVLTQMETLHTRLNKYPNRDIYGIDDDGDCVISFLDDSEMIKLLPTTVVDESLEYYIFKAIRKFFTKEERAEIDEINLIFRTDKRENTVAQVVIPRSVIRGDEFEEEDVDDDEPEVSPELAVIKGEPVTGAPDYVFATQKCDDKVQIVIQNYAAFKANGVNMEVTDDMIDTLGPIMLECGFESIDNDQVVLEHPLWDEITVIKALKSRGMQYSMQLDDALNCEEEE